MTATDRRASSASPLRDYLDDIGSTPCLTAAEEAELAARVARGDPEARDLLARANLRLVIAIARGYLGRGLPLEDLVAEGNLGLLRAVEGFDGALGLRFSTYAAHWIKQSVRATVLRLGRPIRLPLHAVTLVAKWRRAEAALADRLGRRPTEDEVAAALGLPATKRRVAREALRAQALIPHSNSTDEGRELLASEAAAGADVAQALADSEEVRRALARLSHLGERDAMVVRLRFGLGGEPPQTLREIGHRLGLTRERVRQVEKHALAALAQGAEPGSVLR
jgi:RNA polymerase primary sigma factor